MSTVISNMDDVIDSREVISRRDELQSEYDELEAAYEEAEHDQLQALLDHDTVDAKGIPEELRPLIEAVNLAQGNLNDFNTEYGEELASLNALCHDGENASEDWEWGTTLIRGSYFEDYAREMVEDAYDLKIPDVVEVNWEATARNVRMDYTPIEFDGVTYWVR